MVNEGLVTSDQLPLRHILKCLKLLMVRIIDVNSTNEVIAMLSVFFLRH
jgi:hypothetical protein